MEIMMSRMKASRTYTRRTAMKKKPLPCETKTLSFGGKKITAFVVDKWPDAYQIKAMTDKATRKTVKKTK